jgi:lipopolysaccharide transport system ATP-binding protein
MIMDEVLAVGDVNFQQKCLKKMREVATKEGRTVLYVSHNMNTIRQLCSRCVVLQSGKCIYDGDVEEAIGVYENNQAYSIEQKYDLSQKKRIPGITEKCQMQSVFIDVPEVKMAEKLRFNLNVLSQEEIRDAMLRFVVFDKLGMTIGAVYSDMWNLAQGESSTGFVLDTSVLAPGEYSVDIILVSYDGKVQTRHDIVTGAFRFVVQEDQIFYNMEWNKNGWGSIRLPGLSVEEG